MPKNAQNQESVYSATSFASGLYGAVEAQQNAAATDAIKQGMDLFRIAAEKLGAVDPKISQGNLFEYIEAAKFNADAALNNSPLKAVVTAAEGEPHAVADILIKKGNLVIEEVQAKSMEKASNLTHAISNQKYQGMQKLVPDGNAEKVRQLAEKRAQSGTIKAEEYADTAKNTTDRLKAEKIQSEGTSYEENLWAAKNPDIYAAITETKYVAKEAAITGANAAVAGFVVGGVISAVKNSYAVFKGENTAENAIVSTVKDAGHSGLRGATTGVGGTLIRYGATKLGIKALAKSNVAVTIAAGVIDVGASVYSFAKGEITTEELIERVGQTGTCTTYSLYAGTAAGAIFGPVGAIVGSMAGYLIAASIYQSAAAIFQQARLEEVEAERVVAMCQAACQAMEQQQDEFEHLFEANFQARSMEFDACFAAIDAGLTSNNIESTTQALAELAEKFGKTLQFENFQEFDQFMTNSDQPLIL
ncbi:hypothetical protein H6G33_14720 [Calothrix sp. FACHB-1219]|uniref:hypothetical protein n=1 Tax=unclassified Calothrix TaxID=2619626 RepID=UPI0016847A29|nr:MULTISPECIES: hypothetical protein [unclassified Calothrix]MBD2203927.1 hypothetical protein [Calothrix sp. FACHB-168]MBD2218288.1 hypothetical protein [Calothrix sp. FACHB-1219]